MKFIYSALTICLFFSITAHAGNYPFPQNVQYVYGIKPTNAKHTDALNSYNNWKYTYVVDDGTERKRVLFGDAANSTVSEGIAYGMLLAAYADDQTVFDGLWKYYTHHMNGNGVMNWKINADGSVAGYNGATDAEEDAAMALIIAHHQWGSTGAIDYMTDALTLIDNMMLHEVEKPSYVLKPGDAWGGSTVTNPSYFAPAYYRIFYELTGDTQWMQVLEKSYDILALNADPVTGLVSDWCTASGTQSGGRTLNYFYDASRFPWRMATDYLWFGEPRAKDYCTKMANFVKNTVGGSTNIVDGYTRSGTKTGSTHNSTFVGTFALTGMADVSFQTHLNASYTDNVKTYPGGYFDQMLHTVSLFMLTGNFYRLPPPVCESFSLGPDLSLCTSSNYTLDPQISATGRNFKWSTGETTTTISANKKGTYILVIDSSGCVRSDTINLLGLELNLGEDREVPVGDSIVLDAGTSGGGATYTWSTGESSQTITIDSAGLYWVQVDSAGCTDRDSINIGYEKSDQIKIYPNPNEGRFKLLLYDATAEKADIIIYNTQGKLLGKFTVTGIIVGEPVEVDLSLLARGIYFVRVETKNAVKTKKFIIQY